MGVLDTLVALPYQPSCALNGGRQASLDLQWQQAWMGLEGSGAKFLFTAAPDIHDQESAQHMGF